MTALADARVVVADDAALLRHGVCALLRSAGARVVGEAGDGATLRLLVDETGPDLVITDIRMPPGGLEGLAAAADIQRSHPRTAILLLSNHAETRYLQRLMDSVQAGVGYLLKERVTDTDDFLHSVRRVLDGGTAIDPEIAALLVARRRSSLQLRSLTARERDVLTEIATGASNAALGRRLSLSVKTVETHIQRIFDKLDLYDDTDANRRVQAVLSYLRAT